VQGRRLVTKGLPQFSETFSQERAYAGGSSQHAFSAMAALLSGVALFASTDMRPPANVLMSAIFTSIFVLSIILAVRLSIFKKDTEFVLKSEELKAPSTEGRNLLKGLALSLTLILALILPFVLTYLVDMQTWIGLVLGAIIGYCLSDLFFAFLVRDWEGRNGIRLFRYSVFAVTGTNKSMVIERGILGRKI
jgi:hypothetical protein